MDIITAAGRKACEQEAGLELSNDNEPHRRGDRGRSPPPAPLGMGFCTRPLHHLVIADLVRMIVTAWGGT